MAGIAEVAPLPRTPGKIADIAPIGALDSQDASHTRPWLPGDLLPHCVAPGDRSPQRTAGAAVQRVGELSVALAAADIDARSPGMLAAGCAAAIDTCQPTTIRNACGFQQRRGVDR